MRCEAMSVRACVYKHREERDANASSQQQVQVGNEKDRRCLKCLLQQCSASFHIAVHLTRAFGRRDSRRRERPGDDAAVGRPRLHSNGSGEVAECSVLRERIGDHGRAPAMLQRSDEPVEQQSSDTQMSGIVRDNHSNLSTPFIDEERVRDAQRPTVLLRDQPDRVRPCFHVTIDRIVVKVIDDVKEAATTILSARPLQNVAIVTSIAGHNRAYADRSAD